MKLQIYAEEKKLPGRESDRPKTGGGRGSGLIAMLLTVIWAGYLLWTFRDSDAYFINNCIALTPVTAHVLCVAIAAVLSAAGYFGRQRWAMLASGILLAVAAAMMPSYAEAVLVQIVLFVVDYVGMSRQHG